MVVKKLRTIENQIFLKKKMKKNKNTKKKNKTQTKQN